MNKNYGMDLVRVTEMASITAASHFGKANSDLLVAKTRETVFKILSHLPFTSRVLNNVDDYFPKETGSGDEKFDLILLEAEGHKNLADGRGNSTSFIAIAPPDTFALLPSDLCMFKMVTSAEVGGAVDIHDNVETNIRRVARKLGKYIENTTVCINNVPENKNLIERIRATNARVKLIHEGAVAASVATLLNRSTDLFIGTGGVLETLLTAAFVRCLGGEIQSRLFCLKKQGGEISQQRGIEDLEKVYYSEDLAKNDEIAIAATGISDGYFLDGVHFFKDGTETHSFVVRGETKTNRFLKTRHFFDYRPLF